MVNDIKESQSSTNIKMEKLESLIGKINHSAYIIPPAQYFLTRLFHLIKRLNKRVPLCLLYWYRQDLQLWMKLLQLVIENGFPINNIVSTALKVTLCSDAFKYVIGGYYNKLLAWFWYIPP